MIPSPFASESATGIHEGFPIAQFEIGNHRNFVYLILDWKTKSAAVVDPQSNLSPLTQALEKYDFLLKNILLTHTHFDHIAGVPELAHLHPKLPIHVNEMDAHRLATELRARVTPVRDGQKIQVGDLELEVLHTPGHSAGECCFLLKTDPPYLLTGDTLFIRDCGRTDLESGSNEEMFASLQRIKGLDSRTIILPGHHYQKECASTVERELEQSPPLRCRSVDELTALP